MSETPELPPLPERATPTWTAYGRECWEAGRRAGLEEARQRMFDDVHARVRQIEDRFSMYAEGWFSGLMNGLDARSPHCAQTVEDAVKCFGELTARVVAWQARDCGECGGTGRAKP